MITVFKDSCLNANNCDSPATATWLLKFEGRTIYRVAENLGEYLLLTHPFLKCFASQWVIIVASLIRRWITGISLFWVHKSYVYEVLGHPVDMKILVNH